MPSAIQWEGVVKIAFSIHHSVRIALVGGVGLIASAVAPAGTIYFADLYLPDFESGSIRRVGTDGSGLVTLVDVGGGLLGVEVDQVAEKLYWSDSRNFVIRRGNLDGSDATDFVSSGLAFPSAMFIDPPNGRLYWGDQSLEELGAVNLDGSGPAPFLTVSFHRGIAVDAAAGHVYFTTSVTAATGRVMRAGLDGNDQVPLINPASSFFKPASIALDLPGGKMYWTDLVSATIRRANLDGSQMETVYTDPFGRSPRGLALDLENSRMYWGQDTEFEGVGGAIYVANLDGTNLDFVATGLGYVNDLVVVPGDVSPPCDGDVDGNGAVDLTDLATLLSNFGVSAGASREQGDLDGDTDVDLTDLAILLANFGATC